MDAGMLLDRLRPWPRCLTPPPPPPHTQGFRPADLDALLKKVPIKLGGGKMTSALADVLPSGCVQDLERICEDWARSA